MASSRKRFTSDQVIAFFRGAESSDEEDDGAEETFSEYIGVDLSCLQGDESPQAVTDDEDAGAVGVRTLISLPAQEDMDVERPEMSESKRSDGNGDSGDNGSDIEEYGRQYDQGEASNINPEVGDDDYSAAEHSIEHKDHQADGRAQSDNMPPGDHMDPYEASDTTDDSSDESHQASISEAERDEDNDLDICDRLDSDTESDSPGMSTAGYRGRGRARGRGGRGERGRRRVSGRRGRGQTGRQPASGQGTRGGRGRGRGSSTRRSYLEFIPTTAKPISERDEGFTSWISFEPIREPGPHLPEPTSADQQYSPLELFRLFITDDLLDHFVEATKAYAETQKLRKRLMYMRFTKSELSRDEMFRYLGVYLLLSLSSSRNYKKAWNKKSSQVRQCCKCVTTKQEKINCELLFMFFRLSFIFIP